MFTIVIAIYKFNTIYVAVYLIAPFTLRVEIILLQIFEARYEEIRKETNRSNRMRTFVEKCVKFCWLSCIQDPPLVLLYCKNGDKFDDKLFREYQRTGKLVDFMVWPALLLHDKGPVLARGVVEPIKVKR